MKEIKHRAWDKYKNKMIAPNGGDFIGWHAMSNWRDCLIVMQYTGLEDMDGVEIYEGDLLNVFFTSSSEEMNHDCIYEVSIDPLAGITLNFKKLLWESYGHNQYTSDISLSSKYNMIECNHEKGKRKQIVVCDSWGEYHLTGRKWKINDRSYYIKIIGSIYENPELIKKEAKK